MKEELEGIGDHYRAHLAFLSAEMTVVAVFGAVIIGDEAAVLADVDCGSIRFVKESLLEEEGCAMTY